jgi:hypothetical protein
MSGINEPEVILQTILIAGVPVVKIRKGNNIVYRLANGISADALTPVQRTHVTNEVMRLHAQDPVNPAPPTSTVCFAHLRPNAC